VLAKRFGNPGRRIWYMCQGRDFEQLQADIPPPKTIGHGKVVPPNTSDYTTLLIYLLHMSEKVAARLRRHQLAAKTFFIGLRIRDDWVSVKYKRAYVTNDGREIFLLCKELLNKQWQNEGVFQVQVCALDPLPVNGQLELFHESEQQRRPYLSVQDRINNRYGELTLMPARLLKRSTMPNVISPAWKPYGHRQTIQDSQVKEKRPVSHKSEKNNVR
jgi:DNA polymerase-4